MKINVKMQGLAQATRDIRQYSEEAIDGVKRTIVESTVTIQSDAVSLAPEDTGNLKNSIDYNITNDGLTGEIFAGAEYAPEIEFGVAPHVIRAKPGGVLHFKKDGKDIFATKVNHPGSKAQPFLVPAWESERPKFINALKNELNK